MNVASHKARRHGFYFHTFCVALVASTMMGCTQTDTATQSYKGVINLEGVRLGMPEETAKGAILSFVADPGVTQKGYTQYLSRNYDADNGQYCLIYENGQPRRVLVVYNQSPIAKQTALARLKKILPQGAPEESKVEVIASKDEKKHGPVEYHTFGDKIKSELIYTDKTARLVQVISVWSIAKDRKEAAADKPEAAEKEKTK